MTNKAKKEKKLRNYRAIFKDGSEVEFQADGLKEAENAVQDMQKDPEELVELHSSPIEEEEQECRTTKYTQEEIENLCGIHVEYHFGFITVTMLGVYPTLDDQIRKDLNCVGQALQVHEKAYLTLEDIIVIDKDGEKVNGTIVRFYKQSKVHESVIDVTIFLDVARRILMALNRYILRQNEEQFWENLIQAICQNNSSKEDA